MSVAMAGGQGGAKKLAFESVGPPAFDTLLLCVNARPGIRLLT